MDTPPLTGDKGGLQDANISDITSRRRHASGPIYAPDKESASTAPVTDGDLQHLHGDPASPANIVRDPRRSPVTDYPLQHDWAYVDTSRDPKSAEDSLSNNENLSSYLLPHIKL